MAILNVIVAPLSTFQFAAVDMLQDMLAPVPDEAVDGTRSGVFLAPRGQQPRDGTAALRCALVPAQAGPAPVSVYLWSRSAAVGAGNHFYHELDTADDDGARGSVVASYVDAILAGHIEETITRWGRVVVRTVATLMVPTIGQVTVTDYQLSGCLLRLAVPCREVLVRYDRWPGYGRPA